MAKLKKVFDAVTIGTNGMITNKQELDYLISKLQKRKIIIEQDAKLFDIHIKDFPLTLPNFINYVLQIYRLDIENLLALKANDHETVLNSINKYISFLSTASLTNEDIVALLSSLIKNEEILTKAITNFKKSEFILQSVRDDIQKFVWEEIYKTCENKSDEFFIALDVTSNNAEEYQQKNQEKIRFEFEIVRVKKYHDKSNIVTKAKNGIVSHVAMCSDRNIPIKCTKIPKTLYDREVLETFYFKCEALKELLLSKYYEKFLGFDDSDEECECFFFEHIEEKTKLIPFFAAIETENPETSFFFKYLAKEILCALRDLVNKCTYSFDFPITCDNIYYDKSKFRLFISDMKFRNKRKSVMESQEIVEAKALYFYAMILLNLLSIKYPPLRELINELNDKCKSMEEFGKMQTVFDCIEHIENCLTTTLENDTIICIIIECLLTPYKAKIVFDEFYEKKNFLNEIMKKRQKEENAKNEDDNEKKETESEEIPTKKKTNLINLETSKDRDKTAVEQPYYKNNDKNELPTEYAIKQSLTINKLLIHPFYSNTNVDEHFLRFLFKQSEDKNKL